MKIKRYMAASMRAALDQVRLEQGPDAVILSSRRIDEGVEVIAAVDYDEALIAGAARQYALAASAAANAAGRGRCGCAAKKPQCGGADCAGGTRVAGRGDGTRREACGARRRDRPARLCLPARIGGAARGASGARRLRWLAIWPRSPFRRTRSADSPPCSGS